MKKYKLQKLVPFVLISSMLLTGCAKKGECDLPTRHVHLYTKKLDNDITITKYIDSEFLKSYGYSWNADFIEITSIDEKIYNLLDNRGLFNAFDNWNYLYYVMANNHDYLKFYYEYTTTESYTVTDNDGNVSIKTKRVHHDGWTEDPYYIHNTGKTRLYHHKYFAYRVVCKNGKYSLEKSPLVDDIREVIEEYPYVPENCFEEVYETFRFFSIELPDLSPADFDTFNHPDLTNNTPNLESKEEPLKLTLSNGK